MELVKCRRCESPFPPRQTVSGYCGGCAAVRIAELEAENAGLKSELKECWCERFECESREKDGWYVPYTCSGEYAAEALLDNGIVEQHPTVDGKYRYVEKGGE